MKVYVNGDAREIDDRASVALLLESLSLRPRHVAVELNLEVVPRARHAECLLRDGDRLEIVTLVGGG